MNEPLPAKIQRIGLIGGGQLGRMTVQAAARLGLECVVLDPTPDSPAGQLALKQIEASHHDADKIHELASECDILTYELEDINADVLAELELAGHQVAPSAQVLRTIQDKLLQKQFFYQNGIPTADFKAIETPNLADFEAFGFPLVQKARRGGYDGRGVCIMHSTEDFAQHLPVPSFLERFVPAQKEIAVVVARGRNGECKTYPPVEMCFHAEQNMLDVLLSPADISTELADSARQIALKTVNALAGIGVFGVEMFVTEQNSILVNEVAPRTHNSGHHTIEAHITDQFEQHLRAIIGWPLGSTDMLSPAAMLNLLGAPNVSGPAVVHGLADALAIPGVCLHLYGKKDTKPFRKMGHATILHNDINQAKDTAQQVRHMINIVTAKPEATQ